jgi:membrane protein YqaA with SNARE-associated domain
MLKNFFNKINYPIKKIYNWVLHWAKTPYGSFALFLLSFSESSFFPVPPDVLLIALVIGANEKTSIEMPFFNANKNKSYFSAIKFFIIYCVELIKTVFCNIFILLKTFPKSRGAKFAFICSIASVLGGIAGYGIGHFLWYNNSGNYSSIAKLFFKYIFNEKIFQRIKVLYENWDFWIVFTAGFTPLPYKVITITAGVCKINFWIFIFASTISRSARFYLVSFVLWIFGANVKDFIDRYFNLLSLIFMLLLILGVLAFKYIL